MDLPADAEADEALANILATPEGRRDPYPTYERIRRRAPRFRSGLGFAVFALYDDCLATLRHPKLGRSPGQDRFGGERADKADRRAVTMLFANPPEHTRLRRIANSAFSPQRVAALRPAIEARVNQLLDEAFFPGEVVEVISKLALPLPVWVIGELLGVPETDRGWLRPLVRDVAAALEPFTSPEEAEAARRSRQQLTEYFSALLADRRSAPRDDMMSAFASPAAGVPASEAGRDGGEESAQLSDEEIVATSILLFAAGFETTTNLIGNGLVALCANPDQLQRWRQDPGLGRRAVDELLRYDSPTQINARVALEPTEVAGVSLEPGEAVLTLVGSANRDAGRFAEPDQLDLGRADNAPLSFGWGIHHCLGAALARLEGEICFGLLLERFAGFDIAGQLQWRPTISLRGLARLDVVPAMTYSSTPA